MLEVPPTARSSDLFPDRFSSYLFVQIVGTQRLRIPLPSKDGQAM